MKILNKTVLHLAEAELAAEKAKIEKQIEAIRTLSDFTTTQFATGAQEQRDHIGSRSEVHSATLTSKIKEILVAYPGATSSRVKEHLDSNGYTRPRAGGRLKKYDISIAIGKLVKAGAVDKIGGSRPAGFQYAVHR